MKLRKTVLALSTLIVLLLAACGPAASSGGAAAAGPCSKAEIKQTNGKPDLGGCTLRIAVENAYQPFNFIDTSTNKPKGYDYDIFAEICKRINCQTEFIATTWDSMVAVMGGNGKADTFDVGADGITITEERAKNVDFSEPYITSQESLLVRKDENRFSTPNDLKTMTDLKIGTQLGTTNYDAAVALVGKDRVVAFDQFGPAVQALINGDVDAVIIDNVAGMGYVGVSAEKLKLLKLPIHTEELGFMFNKGSSLVAPVNAALDAIKADGTIDTIYKKWFVDYVPAGSATLTDTTTVTATSTVTQ